MTTKEDQATVHVLVPVHNRCALTKNFLIGLRHQSYPNIRVVVIDDGSTDGTGEMIRETYPGADVIPGSGSLWWGGSLQRGMDRLTRDNTPDDDLVLIVNDDTILDPDFVALAVQVLRGAPRALLCARLRDEEAGVSRESGIHIDWLRFAFRPARQAAEIDCLSTRGLFLRWGDMKAIGGFRPRLLPHYWSDYEYTSRARKLGYALLTVPEVALRADLKNSGFHDLDGIIGWPFLQQLFSVKSPLNPLYRSAFVWLAAPWPLKLPALLNVWARALPRILWQGFARQTFPRSAWSALRK